MTEKVLYIILYYCLAIGSIGYIILAFAQSAASGFVALVGFAFFALFLLTLRRIYKGGE